MIEVVERFKTQKSTAEILQKQNENSKQEVRNISSPFLKWFSVKVLVLTELKEQKVKTTFILSKVISKSRNNTLSIILYALNDIQQLQQQP